MGSSTKLFALFLLAMLHNAISAPIECSPRSYGFSTLRTGDSYSGPDDGTFFMRVTPANNSTLICSAIFDSALPTKSDPDLGTPGECDGGPGIGAGGRKGQPGENCRALGKLLLCHGGDIDEFRKCKCNRYACEDCQPNDRASGAVFTITFKSAVRFRDFTVVDLEGESAMSVTFPSGKQTTVDGLGNNSVQTVVLERGFEPGDVITINCKESCAIAQFRLDICQTTSDVVITKKIDRTFSLVADNSTANSASEKNNVDLDAAVTAIPIPGPLGTQDMARSEITINLGASPSDDANEKQQPTVTAIEISPSSQETEKLGIKPLEFIFGPTSPSVGASYEPVVSPGVTPEQTAEITAPAIATSTFAISTYPAPDAEVVTALPVPSQSTPASPFPRPTREPICYVDSPITFNHLSVGSGAFEGPGYKLYTRRIGRGEDEDVSAVFDSENPPPADLDLGSPNALCGSDGPGQGNGGAPGYRGENCQPLGHVLVAHSGNVTELRSVCALCPKCKACAPNDAPGGAEFVFTFTEEALLLDLVVLDVDEVPKSLIITRPSGMKYEYAGLGENGKLVVSLDYARVRDGDMLKIFCKGSCAIVRVDRALCPSTQSQTSSPSASPSAICRKVVENFEGRETGMPVLGGLNWDLETCRFEEGGNTCGVSAIFNTSDPIASDLDLGSPNIKCPGGGPGFGAGGEPGNAGQNCVPQGQVLIAASGDVEYLRFDCQRGYCQPNDHAGGARFTFIFTLPTTLESITILDLDEADGSAVLEFNDGYEIPLRGLGDNSVSVVDLSTVEQTHSSLLPGQYFSIRCVSSCAISELKFSLCF